MRGEVYFPNLDFEKSVVDFGCILNDTEVTRYINITNNSPMEVRYRWSFLIGDKPVTKFNTPPKPVMLEEITEEQEHAEGETKVEVMISHPTENPIDAEEKAEIESTKVFTYLPSFKKYIYRYCTQFAYLQ